MGTMTKALPGALEATKKGLAEVWEELAGYSEAELIAALEETDQGMDEKEDDDKDGMDMPLALQSAAPTGSLAGVRRSVAPCTVNAGT